MKKTIVIISLLFIIGGCSKENMDLNPDNLLIGVWNFSEFRDNTYIYTRSNDFVDGPCYKFNSDGTLTERKNSGFCGTPPISYADYTGSWSMINDTLINVTSGYWGGTMTYMLDIELLNSESLKTILIPQDE
jgi:hypothetical protein